MVECLSLMSLSYKMNSTRFLLLWPRLRWGILAGVLIVGGALSVSLWNAPSGQVEVFVLTKDVAPGDSLSTASLRKVTVPVEAVTDDVVTDRDTFPDVWEGEPLKKGTILTESNIPGSESSRALRSDQARLTVQISASQVRDVDSGDRVELWTTEQMCDQSVCAASLLARDVRIVSIEEVGDSAWGTESMALIDIVVPAGETQRVLGYAESGRLSLVLRHPGVS